MRSNYCSIWYKTLSGIEPTTCKSQGGYFITMKAENKLMSHQVQLSLDGFVDLAVQFDRQVLNVQ